MGGDTRGEGRPPPVSGDGRFWWDGTKWRPIGYARTDFGDFLRRLGRFVRVLVAALTVVVALTWLGDMPVVAMALVACAILYLVYEMILRPRFTQRPRPQAP